MTLFNEMILDSNSLFLKKGFGWVIFYPKGDRLLLCKQNKWLYGGFPGFANIYLKAMEVCKTDIQNLIRLLDKSAELIDKYCKKPCEQDKARQCRKTSKKLKKKIKNEDITNQ